LTSGSSLLLLEINLRAIALHLLETARFFRDFLLDLRDAELSRRFLLIRLCLERGRVFHVEGIESTHVAVAMVG
jgi:hypothetical protein